MKQYVVLVTLMLVLLSISGAFTSPDSQNIQRVWGREEEYWKYVKQGDVENYIKLWHDEFIGWPCGKDHPVGKSSIGQWVQEVRDKKIKVVSTIIREGAEEFGNVVVVHYRFTKVDTFPDGHVEGRGKESKITHTWMNVGDEWRIIGGMCGTLPDQSNSEGTEQLVRADNYRVSDKSLEQLHGSWKSDLFTVTIDKNAKTYAGVALGEKFDHTFEVIEAKANYLVLKLSNGSTITAQFQIDGSLLLTKKGGIPTHLTRVD